MNARSTIAYIARAEVFVVLADFSVVPRQVEALTSLTGVDSTG